MSLLKYTDFLGNSQMNEANQSKEAKSFEDMIGGILADSKIIQDIKYDPSPKELEVIPDGKLGNVDVSLVIGLLQDKKNTDKIKKEFKGIKTIKFNKMTIEI